MQKSESIQPYFDAGRAQIITVEAYANYAPARRGAYDDLVKRGTLTQAEAEAFAREDTVYFQQVSQGDALFSHLVQAFPIVVNPRKEEVITEHLVVKEKAEIFEKNLKFITNPSVEKMKFSYEIQSSH